MGSFGQNRRDMRIRNFFLDQGETLGGAERFLLDFFRSLTDGEIQRIAPAVVGVKSKEYRDLLPEKIPGISFSFPSLKGNIFRKGLATLALLRAARRLKKTVLTHGNSASLQIFANTPRTIFVAFLAKKIFRMPGKLLIMIHDFTIPKWLLGRVCETADVIVVNSMITRKMIRKQISKKASKKIKIVENGVDFEAVKKIPENIPSKVERVVLLGRIDPRKGQKYAVEAADLLLERNPHVQFFLVGSSFSADSQTVAYEKEIRDFVKNRKLENVFFLDAVENPYEVFASADMALVLPTEPETFGRVVVEALAMNTLVLSFDQTGPKQILELFCKQFGLPLEALIVEQGNAMSLAERIGFFADNPENIDLFVQKGRAFVEKNYDLKDTTKQLWKVLVG